MSVLSSEESNTEDEPEQNTDISAEEETVSEEQEIQETDDIITEIDENPETENEGEPDLEKLLSAMTPLQEDIIEENTTDVEIDTNDADDDSADVDATLEQLATEFAEKQDKIAAETKSSGRGRIV